MVDDLRGTSYLQISFSEPAEDPEDQVELEPLSLTCISDEPVPLGNTAYFKLLGSLFGNGINLTESLGNASFDSFQNIETISDTIYFVKDTEKELSRLPINGSFSYSWIGETPGNVVISGKKIISSGGASLTGVLKISYNSYYAKVKLEDVNDEPDGVSSGEAFDVLVTAYRSSDEEKAYDKATFQDVNPVPDDDDEEDKDESVHENEDLSLTCISDEPVPLGNDAFFKLLGTSTITNLSLGTTLGFVEVDRIGVTEEIEEDILFENESSNTLSRIPIVNSNFTYFWIGKNAGNIVFSGQEVKSSGGDLITGILRVSYTSSYIRIRLSNVNNEPTGIDKYEEFEVLVTATKNGAFASDTCSFQRVEEEEEEEPKDVELTVCNYCSGDVLPNASVYLTRVSGGDETFEGTTNSSGTLMLLQITSGMGIRIVHPDYIPSNEDNLSNDTIPDLSGLDT